jgi:hypothetical protein
MCFDLLKLCYKVHLLNLISCNPYVLCKPSPCTNNSYGENYKNPPQLRLGFQKTATFQNDPAGPCVGSVCSFLPFSRPPQSPPSHVRRRRNASAAMPSWNDGESSSQDSLLSEFANGADLSPMSRVRVELGLGFGKIWEFT